MNATTINTLVGSAVTATGILLSTVGRKQTDLRKPTLSPAATYVGGVLTGAGVTLLAKNAITTKSEAGAILAAG